MINFSTIIVDNCTPQIERQNNIIIEMVKDNIDDENIQILHADKKQKSEFNINFTKIIPRNRNIINYYNMYDDNCITNDTVSRKEKLLSPLNINYEPRIVYVPFTRSNKLSSTHKKRVQFSTDVDFFYIPSRNETKEINHILFWNEQDFFVFRKKYILNTTQ